MTLEELLAEKARCANRLYDEFYVELYLALQKEVNTRVEASSLDISGYSLSPSTFLTEWRSDNPRQDWEGTVQ